MIALLKDNRNVDKANVCPSGNILACVACEAAGLGSLCPIQKEAGTAMTFPAQRLAGDTYCPHAQPQETRHYPGRAGQATDTGGAGAHAGAETRCSGAWSGIHCSKRCPEPHSNAVYYWADLCQKVSRR